MACISGPRHTTRELPKFANGLINQRGPVQWLELFSFFVVVLFLFQKNRIVREQIRHISEDTAQVLGVNMDNEEELQLLRKRIHDSGSDTKSIMLGRLDRGLGLWLSTKDVGRVGGWVSSENGRDTVMSDMTFTLARTMMWVIPILGFIGTVQGLSAAVGGFAEFLSGAAELTAIKGAIAEVTIGLGVAFDTTFLALMLVTFVQFPLTSVMRREATLLSDIDIYLDEQFVSRLPSPESQPVVIENRKIRSKPPSAGIFRSDRYEEVLPSPLKSRIGNGRRSSRNYNRYAAARRRRRTRRCAGGGNGTPTSRRPSWPEARPAPGSQATPGESLQKAANAGIVEQRCHHHQSGCEGSGLLRRAGPERALAGVTSTEEFRRRLCACKSIWPTDSSAGV